VFALSRNGEAKSKGLKHPRTVITPKTGKLFKLRLLRHKRPLIGDIPRNDSKELVFIFGILAKRKMKVKKFSTERSNFLNTGHFLNKKALPFREKAFSSRASWKLYD
jgi:hypothetical protein